QAARQRVAQFGSALDAAFPGSTGLGSVKGPAQECVGVLGPCAAIVHVGLRPLDLQLIEDAGQLGNLLVLQLELVRQESQRATEDTAAAEARLPFERVALKMAVARHRASSPITASAVAVVLRLAVLGKVMTQMALDAP